MFRRVLPFILVIIAIGVTAFIGGIFASRLPAVVALISSSTPTQTPTSTPTSTPTNTLTPTITTTASTTPTSTLLATGKWVLDAKRSPIDDSPNVTLSLSAESSAGNLQAPVLIMRCTQAQYYSLFVATNNILADSNTSARIRYDQNAPVTVDTGLSSNKEGLFFAVSNPIVDKLLVHDQFAVEYSPYGQVPTTAVFDIRGFREASNGFWNACNGTTPTPTQTPS